MTELSLFSRDVSGILSNVIIKSSFFFLYLHAGDSISKIEMMRRRKKFLILMNRKREKQSFCILKINKRERRV